MGAYAYCQECQNGLAEPTLGECAEGERPCPSCGARVEVGRNDIVSAVWSLLDRIERLEAIVAARVPRPPA